MEPPNGHPCPECGAPRQRDNTPACACTHRAAEALRDARTAQAAAAEDFDPLRIRPYVEIDAVASGGPDADTARTADEGQPTPPAGAPRPPRPGGPTGASPQGTPGPAATAHSSALPHTDTPRPPGNGSAPTPRGQGRTAEDTPGPAATAHSTAPPHGSAPRPPGNGSAPTPRGQGSGSAADGVPDPAATDGSGTPPQSRVAGTPGPAVAADTEATLPHAGASRPGSAARPPSPADATMPLRPVAPDATAVLPTASPVTAALPIPMAPAATEPSVTDLRMFDGTTGADRVAPEGGGPGRRRSRRRSTLLITAAGACVAVVAAAGYASGLFSYESPSRDTALPDDIRASVPDAPSSSAASTPPQGSASAAPPAPAAPPPSPSRSGSPSASPSKSAPSASASPARSPSPSASQPSASATGAEQAPPDSGRQKGGPTVLRLGDRGPEVTELQLRLRQLYLYDGDTDGSFDDRLADAVRTYQWSRGIQVDDLGVYDRATREKLESETREP
ncbi:peptidoglycan-binding protein [Streptomyces sp. NEAU-H22]|uniref:peptidoglycan-binding domain-containing protein n=1 Tax=Streptomyces sp. NEAU-H22 TaxID=2994655 RepID=UPI0022554334|nr:peptidoglycan-binding protein [Streptomyces sp. NEAU-H22]MCX3288519.1 peptidoglycan-binding protein [Streptomyces sp. NEAU-H22]